MNESWTLKSIQSTLLFFGIIFLGFVLFSCTPESRGFVLPDGDVSFGKTNFVELGCNHCHSISGISWIGKEISNDVNVPLGGEVSSLKTYGELVTSIINPSHKISQKYLRNQELTDKLGNSRMESYAFNDVMTVQELVDIVTFLQTEYKLVKPPLRTPYE